MRPETTWDLNGIIHALKNLQRYTINFDTGRPCLKVPYINKTGSVSVKGTLVEVYDTTAIDFAVDIAVISSNLCVGAISEDGIADGSEVLVIVAGSALVLMKDTIAAVRNQWCGVSNVAGRAYSSASPPAAPTHFLEAGHFVESVGAGTDVLAEICMHWN